MRIVFLDTRLNLETGGGTNYCLDKALVELSSMGHRVSLTTLDSSLNSLCGKGKYKVIEKDIKTRNPTKRQNATARIMAELSEKNDIIHVFDPAYMYAAGMYRKTGNKPVVVSLNNYSVFCTNTSLMDGECHRRCSWMARAMHHPSKNKLLHMSHQFWKSRQMKYAGFVDSFFISSPFCREIYSSMGLDPKKMEVVYPLISSSQGKAGRGEKTSRVLYIGRLEHFKGADILIDAAKELSHLQFDILGDGSQRRMLEAKVAEKNIKNVHIHGHVPIKETERFYANADIFVHPSRAPEPFGRTIVEAMTFGLPVIVSDTGSPPWISRGAGLTFRRGDPKDLANQIEKLSSDEDLRKSFSAHALNRAKKFDYKNTIKRMNNSYESLLLGVR